MPAFAIAASIFSTSASFSPFSPSSFWIVLSCSRSRKRRSRSEIFSFVRSPISCDRRSTSMRCDRMCSTCCSRSSESKVSSSFCFSGSSLSSRLAVMSASSDGARVACSACASSAGTPGSSERISTARSRSCIASASAWVVGVAGSAMRSMRAARKG